MTDAEYLEAALLRQAARLRERIAKSIWTEQCVGATRRSESGSPVAGPVPAKKTRRKRKPLVRAKASMEAVQRGAEMLQLLRQRIG
jgi:hypothetical protein